MTERSTGIASRVEQSYADLIRVVSGLTAAELAVTCDDHGGETVGAVVAHLADGARQVLAWVSGSPPDGDDHHGHDHADPAEVTALLRQSADTAIGLLGGLTDEQLQAVLPAAAGIADGNTPLEQVVINMLDHQAHHLASIEQALAGQAAERTAAGLPQETS